jgi:predicted choloylglycine hydrolase
MENKQLNYHFLVQKGPAYQIGRRQAAVIKSIPGFRDWFCGNSEEWKERYSEVAWQTFKKYCPGLIEELQGWADELEVAPHALVYSQHSYMVPHCSHFFLTPSMNTTGHLLLARSYEFDIETHDFCLSYTAAEGKYSHLGNTVLFLGRLDGMNEHHLAVTMSAGGIPRNMVNPLAPPIQEGLQFWAVIRCILENCRTVEEAIAWVKQVPLGGNPILMLADANGNATRVECFGMRVSVQRLNGDREIFYATNHFQHSDMAAYQSPVMSNSSAREMSIKKFLNEKQARISPDQIKTFLSTPYPDGLDCHFYSEGFGTLYSMILDTTEGSMDICFGSPDCNPWNRFNLQDSAAYLPKEFSIRLPQEKTPQGFWN